MILIAVAHVLSSLWQLKVSLDLHGKSESRSLFLSHTDILTEVLQNCSLSSPLPIIIIFAQSSEFDWLPWQQKG